MKMNYSDDQIFIILSDYIFRRLSELEHSINDTEIRIALRRYDLDDVSRLYRLKSEYNEFKHFSDIIFFYFRRS